jgi:hypothetical protein
MQFTADAMEFCPTVLVTDEKLDETSLRLDTSAMGRLATAETRVVLADTQSSTEIVDTELVEFEPFEPDEVVVNAADIWLRVLPRAMANCAVCCKLPELSALTMLLVGLLLNKPLTRPVITDELTVRVTVWLIQ